MSRAKEVRASGSKEVRRAQAAFEKRMADYVKPDLDPAMAADIQAYVNKGTC